ncbi:alcohol dehydrogenase class-3-like [Oncorhynchus tshawytscha]|uniref:alcohol dehydrogenase class-3-like n=1 Tax=Oncorhynchus tshawytscha TaxID=74940 RepID=UPI001C3D8A6A|nr:alcohol dehydrogenase class-3-like [Oncorhynchus tshawytscha]
MNTESQVIKCKPAVAWEHGKPLSIERVEVAPPRAHKVRIKQVECATLTRGTSMRLVYACIPLVLGHKGSGVVEGASPGVSKFSPGKPVRIMFLLKCDVKTIIGFHNPLRVEPGSTCVVLGLGAVGLATVMGCKVAGAARIIAVDINPGKFDKAEAFWATEFVNPKDHSKPTQEVLVEMTGKGVDFDFFLFLSFQMVKFKAIGLQVRRFVWSLTSVVGIGPLYCLERCKDPWGVCVVGWTENTHAHGVISNRVEAFGECPQTRWGVHEQETYRKLDVFVTHTLTLDQINEALDLLNGGKRT